MYRRQLNVPVYSIKAHSIGYDILVYLVSSPVTTMVLSGGFHVTTNMPIQIGYVLKHAYDLLKPRPTMFFLC